MLAGVDVICADEVIGQGIWSLATRRCIWIDQSAIGQQFVGEDVYLLFGFATFTNDIAAVKVSKGGLDTVARVVGERQADGSGRRNRGVMAVAGAVLCNLVSEL